MTRVFVDASVLFAAALSESGGSREVIRRGIRGELELVISDFALEEVRRNLTGKLPALVPTLETLLAAVPFVHIDATSQQVRAASAYTTLKDAPIVAAAKRSRASFLVSLDRKHLVGNVAVQQGAGLEIVLPETLLTILRSQ